MRILFEGQPYSQELLECYGLDPYVYSSKDGAEGVMPFVGYVYSSKVNDVIFILPKVFLFEGGGEINEEKGLLKIAFGKYAINDVIEIVPEHNPLKSDGLDRVLFGLSTWIYRAIDKYSERHPGSEIIRRSAIRGLNSNKGSDSQTLLDTILALLDFHKQHANLFTYISIINSSGNNKIHWGKTISKVQPIIQNNEPFYAEFRNRDKSINYDEELIILFYSVLEYLRTRFFFPVRANLNYELIKPSRINALIESGRGSRLLRSIRRRYFKDELVHLWKLLYAFFDKSESVRSGKSREEALLAGKFDRVFEDMVDSLISDEIFADLKENEDGKEIDHIYKDRSLVDDSLIYYIGDSKYYFYGSDLEDKSIYKQFTYAKNIIQLNINIFNTPACARNKKEWEIVDNVRYRDPLTEGYNPTPNFFVRGYVRAEDLTDGHACYTEDRLCENNQIIPVNAHFPNRPFDRDTLVLQAYNINFLFVLASYVSNSDDTSVKKRLHDRFRSDLLKVYNAKYDFFRITPTGDVEDFVKAHFEEYIGKMYHTEGAPFIWFAFDKGTTSLDALRKAFSDEASVEAAALGIGQPFGSKLTYSARKVSATTIRKLDDYPDLGDDVDSGIRNGYKFALKAIDSIVEESERNNYKDYFINRVHIIHYSVPKDVDLNHYFEVMNSRGEQLEKHEVVKSRLSQYLSDKKEMATFSRVWEACSEMNIYIQQVFPAVFGGNLNDFNIDRFEDIPMQDESEGKETIINLMQKPVVKKDEESAIEQSDRFQPIIDFPNFLLMVLKITRMKYGDFDPSKFTLDDKELLNEFKFIETLSNVNRADFSRKFAFNLLKAKYLLDNYIVHHSIGDKELSGDNPWKLQRYCLETNNRYKNLSASLDVQKELVHLLSMFEVSFTPKQRKNYLFYCLMYLFDNKNPSAEEYLRFLQNLADKYFYGVYLNPDWLNERNLPKPNAFDSVVLADRKLNVREICRKDIDYKGMFEVIYKQGRSDVPLFVFNYTDYRIWKMYADELRGNNTKKGSEERNIFFKKLGCGDFELDPFNNFYFSRTRINWTAGTPPRTSTRRSTLATSGRRKVRTSTRPRSLPSSCCASRPTPARLHSSRQWPRTGIC